MKGDRGKGETGWDSGINECTLGVVVGYRKEWEETTLLANNSCSVLDRICSVANSMIPMGDIHLFLFSFLDIMLNYNWR